VARISLITARDGVDEDGRDTWDWILESRGSVTRPFQILLHRPPVARAIAELGAQIRFGSSLSDRDRELLIVATARAQGQAFEWESHRPLADQAGVSEAAMACLETGSATEALDEDEAMLIDYVREFVTAGVVGAVTVERLRATHGDAGVVEISATVGYYSMLACVMNTCAP
jgi:4-carboxymuconolactone decarboxylase